MKFNHTTKHHYSIRVKKNFLVKKKPLSSVFCKQCIAAEQQLKHTWFYDIQIEVFTVGLLR
jgi:hypothetical protein